MKEMNHTQSAMFSFVQRNQSSGGSPILRDLQGPICAQCGSLRYFLVFRSSGDGRNGILVSLCRRCRTPCGLTAGEIERACGE
jgi:hypothetical protein